MNGLNRLSAALLAGTASIAGATGAAPVHAQAEAVAEYDLPAQDLERTLRSIARRSGREIIFAPEAVEGRRAPALKGRLTFETAVAAALLESGLVVDYSAGAAIVREPPAAAAAMAEAPWEPEAVARSIVVTGTRIRGTKSPSPVIVTSRRELEQAGVNDLAGFARVLPQNFTGGQNPGVAGGGQQGGQSNINNSATLNLRGLGPDATLTLINGHRIAYDALNQGIDISAIPLGAVERIEVIADGASALYGSDAVAGVANIILRRDFDGLETTARIGASTEGGNAQQQYSAVGGGRWSSGGFMAAADFSRTTPIFADQRDYTEALHPSLTLTLRNRQLSGVVAGHQRLSDRLELEFDGYAMDRRSQKQSPFSPTEDVRTFGLVTRPELRSWAATPTLRAELPAGWLASVSATRAESRTQIHSSIFSPGAMSLSRLSYDNRMTAVEATAEGPLFAAPGGSARLALGGGYRSLVLDTNVTRTVGGTTSTVLDFTESRNVAFAYGELSLPLIGPDTGVPLVERLNLSAALRYERYEGIDEVATPKLGIVYQPHPDITFRASWGRAFKAPTLFQANQVLEGALLPSFIFAPQPTPPLAPGATVLLIGGGRPGLTSERASTWSATAEFSPRFLDGLFLRASYFDVDYRDRIGSPLSGTLSALANPIFRDLIIFNPSAEQVNALIATFPLGLSNQTGAPFDPANVGAILDAALRNTARVRAQGVDLEAGYRIDLGRSGRLLLSAAGSYLETEQQISPSQPVLERAGTIFNPPHWRGRGGIAWERDRLGLAAFLNFVGGTRDRRFVDTEGPGPFVTLDVSASFTTGERGPLRDLEVRISALNLLNEEPDVIREADPAAPTYDSTNQSPFGRFVGLSVRKKW